MLNIRHNSNYTTIKKGFSRFNVNRKIKTGYVILAITITAIIASIISGILFYNIGYHKGFADNQPIAKDGSAIVYVTPSGIKYHRRNCEHINQDNAIDMPMSRAEKQGYTPCSKCH